MRLFLAITLTFFLASCSEQNSVADHALSEFTYKAELPGQDVWQTPNQTLVNGGDCEDYVILLRDRFNKAGYPTEEFEYLVGKRQGVDHMVLRYKGTFYDNYGTTDFYPEFVITRVYSDSFITRRLQYEKKG